MASKKYSLLAGALCLVASAGFAQTTTPTGTGYDVADSTVVPSRRMPQQTEFMQGTYNFPAKPRSMWEVGLKAGSFMVSGDVPATFPGIGFGAHIRKALGYVFSLRLEYMYGIGKGLNWNSNSSGAVVNNYALRRIGYTAATPVYMNYKTTVHDLALEGIITFNNVRFHKAKSGVNVYGIIGIGATGYNTKYNLTGTDGRPYNFASISGNSYPNRKATRDAIKAVLDDSYETQAETEAGKRRPKFFGDSMTLVPVGHFGAGVAFRLNRRLNIAIEDRFTVTKNDLLDGQRWTEQGSLSPDKDAYNYLTVGLNINLGAKAVEPLWWLNPLDYAYQEIRKPRLMILPKPVLPDTDGDGVTDQFDQEVTPAGCPVDSHGVSLDTDGDGVPDCRDKEKVTPTTWQPVDADGIGKAPCPDSTCFEKYGFRNGDCATVLGAMPSIAFTGNASKLTAEQRSMLAGVAARLRQSPNCRITIVGYCTSIKAKQSSGAARAENVRRYLVESEGISNDRITLLLAQPGGDCGTIDLRAE
jgi:outer membrane protein OmpA-like peptidoglycan-associated protein